MQPRQGIDRQRTCRPTNDGSRYGASIDTPSSAKRAATASRRAPPLLAPDDPIGEQPTAMGAEALARATVLREPHAWRECERERRYVWTQARRQRCRDVTERPAHRGKRASRQVQDCRIAAIEAERVIANLEPERDVLPVEPRRERTDQVGSARAADVPIHTNSRSHGSSVSYRLTDDGEEAW